MCHNAHLQQYSETDTYEFLTAVILHLFNQAENSIRFEIRIHLTNNTYGMDLFVQLRYKIFHYIYKMIQET